MKQLANVKFAANEGYVREGTWVCSRTCLNTCNMAYANLITPNCSLKWTLNHPLYHHMLLPISHPCGMCVCVCVCLTCSNCGFVQFFPILICMRGKWELREGRQLISTVMTLKRERWRIYRKRPKLRYEKHDISGSVYKPKWVVKMK